VTWEGQLTKDSKDVAIAAANALGAIMSGKRSDDCQLPIQPPLQSLYTFSDNTLSLLINYTCESVTVFGKTAMSGTEGIAHLKKHFWETKKVRTIQTLR
jgi:hypothetical protein